MRCARFVAYVLLLACFAASASASAQPLRAREAIELRVQALTSRLSLSAQQTIEVRNILLRAQAELVAMRVDRAPGPERHRERQRILWDAEDRIWALLTCPQKDAYHVMERERRAAQLDQVDDAPPEPPPPPPPPRPVRPRRRGGW